MLGVVLAVFVMTPGLGIFLGHQPLGDRDLVAGATVSAAVTAYWRDVAPGAQTAVLGAEEAASGWVIHHVQTVAGVPVDGTRAVTLLRDGAVIYARHRFVPSPSVSTLPRVPAPAARRAALAALATTASAPPEAHGASLRVRAEEGGAARLVWRVPATTAWPRRAWVVDVDAHTGEVTDARETGAGRVAGEILVATEPTCQGDSPEPTPGAYLQWGDGRYADARGGFASETPMKGARVTFTSPYVELRDPGEAIAGPWTFSLAPAPAHNTLELPDVSLRHADAFHYFHRVRDYVAGQPSLSPSQRAWTERRVVLNVNLPGRCNAYYATYQESLDFYPGGPGCIDAARSAQTVFHEYGHSLIAHSSPEPDVSSGLNEGYGDVLATFLSNNPVMGDIKPDCNTVLRTCKNTRTYCRRGCDIKTGHKPYRSAEILCAAWWDLRERLEARYGAEEGDARVIDLFVRHLPLVTGDLQDTYAPLVAADGDDDGDPSNGTRHSCEINAAYGARFPDLQNKLVPCAASQPRLRH